jgi:hypothetical protein
MYTTKKSLDAAERAPSGQNQLRATFIDLPARGSRSRSKILADEVRHD